MTAAEKKARFAALSAQHRADLGVGYSVGPMFGPWSVIGLHRLGGRDNLATKGNGATALRALVSLADELGVTLTLGTSRQRLIPYFEQFGWIVRAEAYGVVVMKRPAA